MKRWVWCCLCLCAAQLTAAAHVLDQYLQVTQLALAPDSVRVELRLIPGALVADRVFALLDADGDGQLAPAEEQAYARRVLQDLTLTLAEQRLPLTLTATQFPARAALREGLGTIRLTFTAAAALQHAGQPRLHFRNEHLPEISSYLVNALIPESETIRITKQERDVLQRSLQLGLQTQSLAKPVWVVWLGGAFAGVCAVLVGFGWQRWRPFPWRQRGGRSLLAPR